MSRFVRNLLIALGCVYLTAQFTEAYQGLPVHRALAIAPAFHPFAFTWQWMTHAFVEVPGDMSLISFGISTYVAANFFPYIEAGYGRTTLVQAIAASIAVAGILATLVALVFHPLRPVSGMSTMVQGLFAFELWNRRHGALHFTLLPGSSTVHSFSAKEVAGVLLGFVIIHFVIVPVLASLALDLGALLGGLLYAIFRERRTARKIVRHSFTVIKGGKSDRMLH